MVYSMAWFDGAAERFHQEIYVKYQQAHERYEQIKKTTNNYLLCKGEEIFKKSSDSQEKFEKLVRMNQHKLNELIQAESVDPSNLAASGRDIGR